MSRSEGPIRRGVLDRYAHVSASTINNPDAYFDNDANRFASWAADEADEAEEAEEGAADHEAADGDGDSTGTPSKTLSKVSVVDWASPDAAAVDAESPARPTPAEMGGPGWFPQYQCPGVASPRRRPEVVHKPTAWTMPHVDRPRPDQTGEAFLLQDTVADLDDSLDDGPGQGVSGSLTVDKLAERFRAAATSAEGSGAFLTPAQFADFYAGLLSSWGDRAKVALPAVPATVFAALDLYQESKLSIDDIAKWALAAGLLD